MKESGFQSKKVYKRFIFFATFPIGSEVENPQDEHFVCPFQMSQLMHYFYYNHNGQIHTEANTEHYSQLSQAVLSEVIMCTYW